MKHTHKIISLAKWVFYTLSLSLLFMNHLGYAANETQLADKPIFSGSKSGNVALALSVEFPTALGSSYMSAYSINTEYLGYFDANKCYSYEITSTNGNYFVPQAASVNHACNTVSNGRWSGNFLNWALTQTIDPMRLALSGGYRSVDLNGLTILEKAWASGQGGTVANPSITTTDLISKSTPFTNLTTLKIKIRGLGNQFYFTSTGNNDDPSLSGGLQPDSSVTSTPVETNVYQMYARVQVCKTNLLEANCTLYPNGDYKPTGLIQKNASKLKFAAFGYLNDGNLLRDGGVLRARMSSIGPTGDYPEWEADTGQFITNPNITDANNSGVSNSGVINYLNKFGLTAPGYKTFDPVGELYYTTARYFRNKGNISSYTSGLDATKKDGFPVIENWNDPIKLSCDLNFIIGVGDTNTHADANLPGSTIKATKEPATPKEITDDFGSLSATTNASVNYTDVQTSTNYIGALEGLGNLGQIYTPWCCNNNSFFMAGIAYDIHTRDIRPDIEGLQTVTTYWLDVLESGDRKNFGSTAGMRNQFWLTAKYGGFDVPTNYDPYSIFNSSPATANWDSDNNGDPDNYFRANSPSAMISGLNEAFDRIRTQMNVATTGFALPSPNIILGDMSFSASYNSEFWTGTVTGNKVSYSTGSPVGTALWTTDSTLEVQGAGSGWDTKRFIATAKCTTKDTQGKSTCTGVPFRYDSLNANDQTAISTIGILTNVGHDAVNFLRGDRSNDDIFRKRNVLLGDIVNSQIRAVGKPDAPYSDSRNPGYQDFMAAHKNRSTVAYVGANDGMLHAFRGSDGKELFAYVPNALFQGPNNSPNDDGLAALVKASFAHHPYVDSSPVVVDVNFGGGDTDWHSLLIGGLGKGGKSYYALDVTDPDGISDETTLATKVKWEFTHKDLGFSFGRPVVVKAGGKWIVILTSGYNNSDGKGYFFILDANTGELIKQVSTGEPYTTDAGLAHATAFIADGRDFTADAAYAGDLHGNVWRLDLRDAANNNYPTPVKIAKLMSANSDVQPITVSPMVEVDRTTSKRYVFVGTGKLLSENDINTIKTQTFYAIYDGTDKDFFSATTIPSVTGGYPLTRDDMVNHSNNPNAVTENTQKPMGYYIDFDAGYRINTSMDTSAGVIAFAANKISGNQCNVYAEFRGYALNYGTGQSLFYVYNTSTPQAYYQGNGLVTGISIYRKPDSTNLSVNYSNTDGNEPNKTLDTKSSAPNFQLLNWRTIPNND